MFEYLENGKRLYFQVKINQFTISKVSELLKTSDLREKTIFIGSGCSDRFRNLLQYKDRYLQAQQGILNENKQELLEEMKDICEKKFIDVKSFLKCDFLWLTA